MNIPKWQRTNETKMTKVIEKMQMISWSLFWLFSQIATSFCGWSAACMLFVAS